MALAAAPATAPVTDTPRPERRRPPLRGQIAERAGVRSLAAARLLPVTPWLEELLPAGGLQRGTTTVVDGAGSAAGATSLALELLAGASISGHWCAAAGIPDLGLVAAGERGIELARFVLVPDLGPSGQWQQVVATLFDAVDAVLLSPPVGIRPADARRIGARGRDRGTAVIVLDRHGRWPVPADLRCRVTRSSWTGLSPGYGLLSSREGEVEVSGRGAAAHPRRAGLQLPA